MKLFSLLGSVCLIVASPALSSIVAASRQAQSRFIDIIVTYPDRRPIPNVIITVQGVSTEEKTNEAGKVRIVLARDTPLEVRLDFYIIAAPSDLDIISPWCRCASLKDNSNSSQNVVEVVMAPRQYRNMIEVSSRKEFIEKGIGKAPPISIAEEDALKKGREQTYHDYVLNLIESDFEEEVLKAEIPVLVFVEDDSGKIYALMRPILEEFAREFDRKIKVVFVDKLVNKILTQNLGAYENPSLILYKEGKELERRTGNLSKRAILKLVEKVWEPK